MNILFLPEETYPTRRSTLIELWNTEMVARGCQIFWIMRSTKKNKSIKKELWGESQVIVTRSFSNKTLIGKFKNRIINVIDKYRHSKKLIRENKIDIIQVRNGIEEGVIALLLRLKYKIPVSFFLSSMHGFLAKQLLQNNFSGITLRIILMVNKLKAHFYLKILRSVDFIQTITDSMHHKFRRKNIQKNHLTISLCASTRFINIDSEASNEGSKIQNLMYVGSINRSRKINFLLESFKLIKQSFRNVKLTIIGGDELGGEMAELISKAEDLGIQKDVNLIGHVDYSNIPNYLVQADIGLSIIPPYDFYVVSSPTKCVEYLSAGTPVIANREIIDQKDILSKSGGGLMVSYNPEQCSKAVVFLLQNPDISKKMAERGRKWIAENRHYSDLSEKLNQKYLHTIENFNV